MFDTLPQNVEKNLDWKKDQYEPFLTNLIERDLTVETLQSWMLDWTAFDKFFEEVYGRCYVATSQDTTDEAAEERYKYFINEVHPLVASYTDKLNRKLLESGLEPENFAIQLRKIRSQVELFREENLPIQAEIAQLSMEYNKIAGAQTVKWQGGETTLDQLGAVFHDTDRDKRERAWKLAMERHLEDREALNALWKQLMDLRAQLAKNADMTDFRDYTWKRYNRFDYTPQENETFHNAIETVVVPAAVTQRDKLRQQLGIDQLRPWDINTTSRGGHPDPKGRPPLKPYETLDQLKTSLLTIFNRIDPTLGDYFRIMIEEELLDLDNRKGKAPGGYCIDLPVVERPFIFMNAVGIHDDVQVLLHEGGHAFHNFELTNLPYSQQWHFPAEFAEVASTTMEYMGGAYFADDDVGLYNSEDATRARVKHLENGLFFWPYMAIVDCFQHWVYTHHDEASDPVHCDRKWSELWDRFIPDVDFTGFEDFKATGWHRKLHIFQIPFYYIEYGLAQLGAVQVWANSLKDQTKAVKQYREALALGGTRSLPQLFSAAGAKFSFDAATLGGVVELIEMTLNNASQ